eukprot:CAMPEP_0201925814 /NCGR_PEP_ID=MMETSP0903-20130614/14918_1 /ASSEMBLY_ACC=CAM_ASM_000552 /TAXON_ID=420261 /ORGANISM="Thalassiosira antarctica, Strain CCMP982" /LENGTH=33 /DNA_ID= /DNA_START= /DNA_END= /DNA_ORIENTATION=
MTTTTKTKTPDEELVDPTAQALLRALTSPHPHH